MRSYSLLTRHPGNVALFRAVELSLLASLAGWPLHLHVEGLRGTGKTTILRSARGILPPIRRVKDCPYNCDPRFPHCPLHAGLAPEAVAALGTEEIPMPFCEVSHSAKVGTVAGSIDLSLLASREHPSAALLPGTLARAHRGIVFVDEINRLADTSPELTDLLLDAMGTRPGRLQIEETGLATVELPLQVTIWAASNPDEDPGPLEDIRRQLADRFDLNVGMGRARSRDTVLEILELADRTLQRLATSPGPDEDLDAWAPPPAMPAADSSAERQSVLTTPAAAAAATPSAASTRFYGAESPELRRLFQSRAGRAGRATMPASVRKTIAELYVECGLESLRTAEAVQICARAACALDGRDEVSLDDLRGVLPLVLGQRVEASVLERFLARVDQEGPQRPAAAAKPGPAGSGIAGSGTAQQDQSQAAASAETDILLAEGASGQGTNPTAGARRGLDTEQDPAGGSLSPADETSGARLGLDGIFSRLMAKVRGKSAMAGASSARGAGGTGSSSAASGAGSGDGGAGLDPATSPVLAPPERARALAEMAPEHALRFPDDAAGGRA